jgi:hypothetical protein
MYLSCTRIVAHAYAQLTLLLPAALQPGLNYTARPLQNDMDSLEQIQGMPPGMYHRYGVLDDMDDDEDEPSREDMADGFGGSGAYNADMLVAGMAGLGVSDAAEGGEQPSGAEEGAAGSEEGGAGRGIGNWSLLAHPGGRLRHCASGGLSVVARSYGGWSLVGAAAVRAVAYR